MWPVAAILAGLFLWQSNVSLNRKNEVLDLKTKDQTGTITIQKKVINVVKNTKAASFERNIKRMYDGEL
jgi:hypothetical protein